MFSKSQEIFAKKCRKNKKIFSKSIPRILDGIVLAEIVIKILIVYIDSIVLLVGKTLRRYACVTCAH